MNKLMRILSGHLALAAFALSSSATAKDYATESQEKEAGRTVLMDFSSCAADQQPEIARRYILMPLEARLPEADWKKLLNAKCMLLRGGKLRMNRFYFRAGLAQRLIDKGNLTLNREELSSVAPLVWDEPPTQKALERNGQTAEKAAYDHEHAIANGYASRLGECIVRTDPGKALDVFATRIDSQDERGALQALALALMACVPEGEQVALTRTNLRAGLAIAYFRLGAALEGGQG